MVSWWLPAVVTVMLLMVAVLAVPLPMNFTFAPPEHAAQVAGAACPVNVLPDASASTVLGGGVVLPPAYAEASHSSSMASVLVLEYMLFTTSRMYRAVVLTSMYCAPLALGRLPVLTVEKLDPSLLDWI